MTVREVFDAHFHIIDPRFPLVPNQGYLPDPFSCADYRSACAALALHPVGGAVVSGSFQAFDQGYLRAALAELGEGFYGVTQCPQDTTDDEILSLHDAGVRAVRFNLFRGGSENVRHLEHLARRVHDLAGWHVELYVDSAQLPALAPLLGRLPRASIDHLGLSRSGFRTLLQLVESGVRVKATGFSRTDLDVVAALREIDAIDPAALLFGSDLPGTRAPRPFGAGDLALLAEALDDEGLQRVLIRNGRALYQGGRDVSPRS